MGLVVETGAADMDRWRVVDETFFLGVAVEAGHCAEPPCNRGPGSSPLLEQPTEQLDVSPAHAEEANAAVSAEGQGTGAGPWRKRHG